MAAEPFGPGSAALCGDGLEHIGQVARVIAGIGHYPGAEHVGLCFVFAAEFGHPRGGTEHTELGTGLAREDRSAEDHSDHPDLIAEAALFGLLCGRVTKRDM